MPQNREKQGTKSARKSRKKPAARARQPQKRNSGTWKPGCPSPNPGGRPAVLREIQDAARLKYSDLVLERLAHLVNHASDAVARAAACDLWDRIWGRPAQALQVSGPDGGPVETQGHLEVQHHVPSSDTVLAVLDILRHARVAPMDAAGPGAEPGPSPAGEVPAQGTQADPQAAGVPVPPAP